MQAHGAVTGLAVDACELVRSLSLPTLAPFLADWPDTLEATRIVPACSLPVLRWLPAVAATDRGYALPLVADLCRNAWSLAWQQSYTPRQVSAVFLQNYGWTEILGLDAPVSASRVACGFLLLGPATLYPQHRHPAEEIYVPLCGTARWQQGDGAWRERSPGSVIHHAHGELHSMHTGAEPLLALYVWRGENLKQKACLEPESTH